MEPNAHGSSHACAWLHLAALIHIHVYSYTWLQPCAHGPSTHVHVHGYTGLWPACIQLHIHSYTWLQPCAQGPSHTCTWLHTAVATHVYNYIYIATHGCNHVHKALVTHVHGYTQLWPHMYTTTSRKLTALNMMCKVIGILKLKAMLLITCTTKNMVTMRK